MKTSISFNALGDRMKSYEKVETSRKAMPMIPVMARIDGRSFHTFTRGMDRPFDLNLSGMMIDTTIALVEQTGALMGYTQSDEISLVWLEDGNGSKLWFDGKFYKMTSQLAAIASVEFYDMVCERMGAYAYHRPTFDARVWQVPNKTEAANAFLWRESDATKNSISMAAQSVFSHKQLHGKKGSEKQDMLMSKGINWNDYPSFFKRGTYVSSRKELIKFTTDEIEQLPKKHAARSNPFLMVERKSVKVLDMPPFTKVINREEVIFDGEDPKTNEC